MKIPVGTKVTIDLWDSVNRRGMVKHSADTLSLLRAESDHHMKKGQNAIVIKSYENFVQIVPDDEFSIAIRDIGKFLHLDQNILTSFIWNRLKQNFESTGGIASILDLFHYFQQTSLSSFITLDALYKISKINSLPFECLEEEGNLYFILRDSERMNDSQIILNLAKDDQILSITRIHQKTQWSELRIRKTLEYVKKKGYCKVQSSFKDGELYYFPHN